MRRRVLVAEASPTLQTLIRMTLAAEDLAVECVADGRRALEVARQEPPQLVIVDAALPGIDGYSVAEALRDMHVTAKARVLLLVPDYAPPDLERMMHVGVHDVLSRPFEQHALLERVRGLLGPGQPPQPEPEALPEPEPVDAEQLRALVAEIVDERLGAALDAAVERAVARVAGPMVREALDAALASTLEATPSIALGPRAEGALEAAARDVVRDHLAARGKQLLGPAIEPVVWKVVPAIAEDLIREEIRRLTEEGTG